MTIAKVRKRKPRQPYGSLLGLLTGCLVTLIGVFSGLDPFTIFCRALIAAVLVGVFTFVGISVIRLANIPNETSVN